MAGVWKRDGTVTVTSGSKRVIGVGTTFADPKNGAAKGHIFTQISGSAVDLYEVDYVVSNTELYLVQAFRGTTASGAAYAIITTFSDSIPEFSRKLTATLASYQEQSDVLQLLYTSDAAEITVTAPDGTTHKLIPWKRVTSEGEGQAARAKVEADRAKTEADKAAQAVIDSAVPFPDVWIPFNDSLRMFAGYGREVKVGDDVVARMVNFERSTTATYIDKSGVLRTAAINEPRFEKQGLLLEGQSSNVFNRPSSGDFSYINPGVIQSAGTISLPFDVFQKTITSSSATPSNNNRLLADIYNMPNPAATNGGAVTVSAIMFGDADAIIATEPRITLSPVITGATNTLTRLTSGAVRVVCTGNVAAGSPSVFSGIQLTWLNRLPVVAVGCYQIEPLPFASSYIPTNGAAVTRAADKCWIKTLGNIAASPFTIAMEVNFKGINASNRYARLFTCEPGCYVFFTDTVMSGRFNSASAITAFSLNPIGRSVGGMVFNGESAKMFSNNKIGPSSVISSISDNDVAGNLIFGTTTSWSTADTLFGHIRNFRIWHHALSDTQIRGLK